MQGAKSVKEYLARLMSAAATVADPVKGLRLTMNEYSNTGVSRFPIACRCEAARLPTIAGEWFIPPSAQLTKRNLYIHGGGWASGSVDTHRHLIDAIAVASRRPTLAVDYRLAPEHKFPAGLDDCRSALAAIFNAGPDGTLRADSVAVLGDSAGGNLAAAVTIDAVRSGIDIPDALVMLSPVTDVRSPDAERAGVADPVVSALGLAACTDMYLEDNRSAADERVSPLAAPSEILARLPRTLIQVGSDEHLRDDAVAFAQALWRSKVAVHLSVWPEMPHVFHLFSQELMSARQAIREIGEFLDQ